MKKLCLLAFAMSVTLAPAMGSPAPQLLLLPSAASASFAQSSFAYCFGDGTGTPCPCGANGQPGEGCKNSSGTWGGVLTGNGVTQVLVDSFQLDVTQVPASKPGILLLGSNQMNGGLGNPVGDGLLCVGGQTMRSQVQVTTEGGTTSFTDFQGAPFGASISGLGVPTNYVFWYRDSANSCSGSGFNFTNAWTVTWAVGNPPLPMVLIPAGTFMMGSNAPSGDPYFGNTNTKPVHFVTISKNFRMSQTEITQGQYQKIMGVNPSNFLGVNRPVEKVSWYDARAYCAALTALERAAGNLPSTHEYRLPTEAEWEYACRAGTTTEFNVGPELYCWEAKFSYSYHNHSSCNSSSTVAVGSYSPNLFGLYDMHGNVFEWCLDAVSDYSAGDATDPFVTGGLYRVSRGGSWWGKSSSCRSALRSFSFAGILNASYGFRVVLSKVLVP